MAGSRILAVLPLLLTSLVVGTAVAADCDSVLVPTKEQAASDFHAVMSYLDIVSREDFDRRKSGGGGKVGIPLVDGLIDASASYDEFDENRRSLFQKQTFSSQEKESRTFLKTFLPDRVVDAWVDCITDKKKLAVYPRNITDSGFTLRIEWKPSSDNPLATAKIEVHQGGVLAIGGHKSSSIEEVWNGQKSPSYMVERDPQRDIRIIVNIGSTSDDFVVQASRPKEKKTPNIAEFIQRDAFERNEVWWPGDAKKAITNTTNALCRAACLNSENYPWCQGWLFKKPGTGAQENTCWLFESVAEASTEPKNLGGQVILRFKK